MAVTQAPSPFLTRPLSLPRNKGLPARDARCYFVLIFMPEYTPQWPRSSHTINVYSVNRRYMCLDECDAAQTRYKTEVVCLPSFMPFQC